MKLKSAILGLGQIGIGFDLNENRSKAGDIWTHYSGYKNLSDSFELVAGVDPDPNVLERVYEYDQSMALFKSREELLQLNIDVVSICTPENFHFDDLLWTAKNFKGVFIEKPLFASNGEVDFSLLKIEDVAVEVNYYKRDEPSIDKLIGVLGEEKIIKIICKYSGPYDAVGSHAVDLLNFISPIKKLLHQNNSADGFDVYFLNHDGSSSLLIHTGDRYNLIFEIEVITDKARYIVSKNLSEYSRSEFINSTRYSGYKELGDKSVVNFLSNPNRIIKSMQLIYESILHNKFKNINFKKSIESQKWFGAVKGIK